MKSFKESFNTLIERKLQLSSEEKVIKELTKLGKNQDVTAVITLEGTTYKLYVDNTKLNTFESAEAAEKEVSSFLKVMGV
jgi:hypothetical protein